tara:strand:- start:661 stop:2079 length:1419 start_codon:yes stop_codon:yes gene_type:complete
MQFQPVILAGGSGTRLWPLSRSSNPKQFHPISDDKNSLFQETLKRVEFGNSYNPIIVTNEGHRFIVFNQMVEVGISPNTIIVEPVARNTAPALTLACMYMDFIENDSIVLVLPSDHTVRDIDKFREIISEGLPLADAGKIVTFGIVPDSPVTGYGYLEINHVKDRFSEVLDFIEKPTFDVAKRFVEEGKHLWNSGIFMMKKSVWLENISSYEPELFKGCRLAIESGTKDGIFYRPEVKHVQNIEQISIDNAVMEKILPDKEIGVVFPLDVGWSDLGDWKSLASIFDSDLDNNVLKGDVKTLETNNSFIMSESRLIVSVGVEDLIIVETADAVLVTNRDHVQNVREIVQNLKKEGRVEFETHRKVDRPWGSYEILDIGEGYQVKRLVINPSSSLSLQLHFKRSEHWVIVKGIAKITKGEESFELNKNESTFVPQGITHRIENITDSPVEMIEIQVGDYLGEDDIVRIQDKYNR